MKLVYQNNGRRIYGAGIDLLDFEVVATPEPVLVSSGGSSESEVLDQIITTHTGATYYNNYVIGKSIIQDEYRLVERRPYESSNPAIGLMTNGYLSRVTDGVVTAFIRTPLGTRGVRCDMSQYSETTLQTTTWKPGSLASHMVSNIVGRTVFGNPATKLPMFSVLDWNTPNFVRNTSFWASGIDLTCISPANVASGPYRAGVAVTPKHVWGAAHYPLYVGDVLYFVTMDNQVVTRTVTQVRYFTAYDNWVSNDVIIASLDSDLPGTITPAKVPPANFVDDYLPNFGDGIYLWGTDAQKNGLIRTFMKMVDHSVAFLGILGTAPLNEYYQNFISGDSASPQFVIIDDELVFLAAITSCCNGQGVASWETLDHANELIDQMDSGYSLTEIDLSSFPSY